MNLQLEYNRIIEQLKEKYPNLKDDPNLEKKKVLRYEDNKQD